MPSQYSAIVTDGLWRKSLSAIRSLGKAGFRVTVMGESIFTTGFWSKYTSKRLRKPTAKSDPEGFGNALTEELQKNPDAVILPMEDPTLKWTAVHIEEIQKLGKILIPNAKQIEITQDKSLTLLIAEGLGLPCPKTWRPRDSNEFATQALALNGEFIVKPRTGTGSSGILYDRFRDTAVLMRHWDIYGPMLIQERIPSKGRGQGVSCLMDSNGECVASFAHERLQQYPNSGGPSTDRISILAPELEAMSIALLKKLSWRGIGMVEWKLDPRDQKPKLMEINPRFWGSLELAVRAGVDFPKLYAYAALGQKLGPPPRYADGVRCRWMIPGEILRYVTQPRSERESLWQFLSGLPGLAEEWDSSDLRGGLSTLICTGALALNPRYWAYLHRG